MLKQPANHLLDHGELGGYIKNALSSGLLAPSDLLSMQIQNLMLLILDKSSHGEIKLTHAKISALTAEAGIADNISRTTITKALAILDLYNENAPRTRSVNLIDFAIESRLLPLLESRNNIGEETYKARLRRLNRMVLLPLALTKLQIDVLGNISSPVALKRMLPNYALRMSNMTETTAEATLIYLENVDLGVGMRSLQLSTKSKLSKTLTYSMVGECSALAGYVADLHDNFEGGVWAERMSACFDDFIESLDGVVAFLEHMSDLGGSKKRSVGIYHLAMMGLVESDPILKAQISIFK